MRSYSPAGTRWYSFDAGTLKNGSAGILTKKFSHSKTASFTTTASAEVGASASTVVAEVSAKFGVSVAVIGSYTAGQEFSVTAPPHSTVSYRDGILIRTYKVTRTQTFSNCGTRKYSGAVNVADNYSEAW